ncbi:hypothetical protein BGZ70_009870 [Mortierella alpina]|uniref:Sodium/calcium exchanger membrane region domain-containing protein n=1 Tax=Mortierella alpina TaxID=64518 RepID=A0A9P6J2H6_MORAP|nr:hypothetical protein BGZ70_009870 [Mortierella alpina]
MINYPLLYFCNLSSLPALALIIMTGVTFLAFGNASPDIFSTFSAIGSGSSTLAVGEVVGAASFVTSVVVGSMAIVKPFKVSRAPFLRDLIFFTGCIVFILYVVVTKKITLVQSILLLVAYAIYVTVVVFGNWKRKRVPPPQAALEDTDPEQAHVDDDPPEALESNPREGQFLNPQQEQTRPLDVPPASSGTQLVPLSRQGSTLAAFDPSYNPKSSARRCPAIVIDTAQPSNYPNGHEKRGGYAAVRRGSESSCESLPSHNGQPEHSHAQFQQALLHHLLILPDRSDPMNRPRSPIFQDPPGGSFQDSIPKTSFKQRCSLVFKDWVVPVYFPTMLSWSTKKWHSKLLAVASIPIVLVLTLTLPVVDLSEYPEEERTVVHPVESAAAEQIPDGTSIKQEDQERPYNGWCQVASMIQVVLAPVFITAVITTAAHKGHMVILGALGGGILVSVLIFLFSTEETPPRFYEALAFVGFLVAMTWIFVVANEVVGILQAYGMILGVSDAILGLTVFAMGNSLGDLVANVTIAKMGFPRMALSACFGGPLLNMLVGLGISGAYVTLKTQEDIPLEISPSLFVSLVAVLLTMLGMFVVVPRNGYVFARWWGWTLVAVYVVSMVVNVILEVKHTRPLLS